MRVTILVICAQACFFQLVICQCLNRAGIAGPGIGPGIAPVLGLGAGLALEGLGAGCGVASTGGTFAVSSASPIPPTGLNVLSENLYEGGLLVEGNLPLLGSVGVEGALGTAGAGAVSYGCGDGALGIAVEEVPIVTGILTPGLVGRRLAGGRLAPGLGYGAGPRYGNGLVGTRFRPGCGCGCGAIY